MLDKLLKNGMLLLLIIAVGYILFLRECRTPSIGKDQVLVSKVTWDSIISIKLKPPEIIRDTIRIPGKVKIIEKPAPTAESTKDSSIRHYSDSLLNKEINVWVNFNVNGRLLDWQWKYRPIVTKVLEIQKVYEPKLIYNSVPIPVSQSGLYIYGMGGGNSQAFLVGGGFDFITKKNTELGYLYQRYGSLNFHSIKIGIKILPK